MRIYLAIMAGGAVGSALRYAVSFWVTTWTGELFPWGTMLVNITGSFVIGLIMALAGPDGPLLISPLLRTFLVIGVCGGYTTFSSFSLQTVMLMQSGQWLWATGNILLSVVLCLLATMAGYAVTAVLPWKV